MHIRGLLPEDPKLAKKIVMESQHYEIIDGVLHHESPSYPGHWCIVVPQQLRPQLLHEAHQSIDDQEESDVERGYTLLLTLYTCVHMPYY